MTPIKLLPPLAVAALALTACSKSDTSPEPAHNAVTAAMPDAASTPGAVGPGATAPHAPRPPNQQLPNPVPPGNGPSPQANPADRPQQ